MSLESAKSVVPPVRPGHKRKWTLEAAREVVAHYHEHGFQKTHARYGTGGSQLDRLRAMVGDKDTPSRVPVRKMNGNGSGKAGTSRQTYLLARKLKDAVTERLRAGEDPR